MDEIKEIANYMEIAMKDCSKCPLENICETDCSGAWEQFLRSNSPDSFTLSITSISLELIDTLLKGDEIEE